LVFPRYPCISRLLCTNQSPLNCPSHLHRPHGCNIIAMLLRNVRPPFDPPFSRHTPYNIGHCNIVYRLTRGEPWLAHAVHGGLLRYSHPIPRYWVNPNPPMFTPPPVLRLAGKWRLGLTRRRAACGEPWLSHAVHGGPLRYSHPTPRYWVHPNPPMCIPRYCASQANGGRRAARGEPWLSHTVHGSLRQRLLHRRPPRLQCQAERAAARTCRGAAHALVDA